MSSANASPTSLQIPPGYAPDRESYSTGLRRSVLVHLGIFFIVLLKALVFPGKPIPFTPALRVDIVGLPDVLKKDLAKISRTPPAAEPQDQGKKQPEPVLPKPEAPKLAQQKQAPPIKERVEPPTPDEMVLKPKQAAKERQSKLLGALKRIQALEKIREDATAESRVASKTSTLVKGNKLSAGTSLSADAKESDEASYLDLLRDRLQENWALPVWLARQKFAAQVLLRIDSRGYVQGLQFARSSGNPQFDDAVRKAIQQSQPFPPPPQGIGGDVASNGILVGFPL